VARVNVASSQILNPQIATRLYEEPRCARCETWIHVQPWLVGQRLFRALARHPHEPRRGGCRSVHKSASVRHVRHRRPGAAFRNVLDDRPRRAGHGQVSCVERRREQLAITVKDQVPARHVPRASSALDDHPSLAGREHQRFDARVTAAPGGSKQNRVGPRKDGGPRLEDLLASAVQHH
jgi:hypothetical protein